MKVILQNNSLPWLYWADKLKDSTMEKDVGIKGDNVFFHNVMGFKCHKEIWIGVSD